MHDSFRFDLLCRLFERSGHIDINQSSLSVCVILNLKQKEWESDEMDDSRKLYDWKQGIIKQPQQQQ